MIDKLRQIWPLAVSGIVGFLIAAILFLPQVYPSNQNIYRIIRERINVLKDSLSRNPEILIKYRQLKQNDY